LNDRKIQELGWTPGGQTVLEYLTTMSRIFLISAEFSNIALDQYRQPYHQDNHRYTHAESCGAFPTALASRRFPLARIFSSEDPAFPKLIQLATIELLRSERRPNHELLKNSWSLVPVEPKINERLAAGS
jgi:hypothetical protein